MAWNETSDEVTHVQRQIRLEQELHPKFGCWNYPANQSQVDFVTASERPEYLVRLFLVHDSFAQPKKYLVTTLKISTPQKIINELETVYSSRCKKKHSQSMPPSK